MENYKVRVNNWDESKEVQELYIALGATDSVEQITSKWVCLYYNQITFYDLLPNVDFKQVTLQHLRDLVVLKRNSIDDATHYHGGSKYYLTDSEFYQYSENKWVNIDEYVDGMTFNKIEKEMKKNEYLVKNMYGEYKLTDHHSGFNVKDLIEVPEGAEIFLLDESCGEDILYFVKHDGEVFHECYIDTTDVPNNTWIKGTIKKLHKGMGKVLWKRNLTITRTSIQDKLKFIEKWLNGEKIQYILGDVSEKTQVDKYRWHNFTEGAMQYIKRSDIKFREAPKYVTINGIEFKSVESLLKHVKKNFDL